MLEIRELWSFPGKTWIDVCSPPFEHWQQRNKPINPAWRINKSVGLNYMRLSDGQFPGIWVTYILLHNWEAQSWTGMDLENCITIFQPLPIFFSFNDSWLCFFLKKKYQFGRWPWASCNILSFANCNFRSFLSFVHFLSFWNFMRIRLPSRRGHFNLQTVATLPEAFPDPWVDDTKKFSIWILKISFIIAILLLFPGLLIFLPFYFEILAEAFHD